MSLMAAHQPDLPREGQQGARPRRGPARDPRLQLPAPARAAARRYAAASPTWRPAASGSSCRSTSSSSSPTSSRPRPQKAIDDGPRGPRPRGADPQVRPRPARSPTSRCSTPSSRARRRSSPSPSSGCRPRSRPSAPARRRSRRPTPPPRRRPASTRRSRASARRWATSAWPIQRAEDKTAQMQARAGAIDELLASGALDDVSAIGSGDDITRELERDELAGRRRGRAGPAQGGSPPGPAARRSRPRPSRATSSTPTPREAGVGLGPRSPNAEQGRLAMIVRILGEGQYDVADARAGPAQRARRRARVAPSRPATRRRSAAALNHAARRRTHASGSPHRRRDSLDDSDLILPPADATIDEVREMLSDDGLIPG